MKINILIEQLILDGLPVEQRDGATVQKAVESEFAQLLEQNGPGSALQSSVSLPSTPSSPIQIANDSDQQSPRQQVNKSPDQA